MVTIYYAFKPQKEIKEAIGAAITALLEAPESKGFSEIQRRKTIDDAYEGRTARANSKTEKEKIEIIFFILFTPFLLKD